MKKLITFALLAVILCGCVSPAIGQRTKLKVGFRDITVDPVYNDLGSIAQPGTQDTDFVIEISAAAGVDIEQIASMLYEIAPDGSYSIGINGNLVADTTKQAEALKTIEALTAAERAAILPKLFGLLAAP